MNIKSTINQKNWPFLPSAGAADWCHLQHIKTLMGLSRRRLSRDEVLALIDTRQIRWAWDISRQDARRPEIRIWRESLVAYLAGESGGAVPVANVLCLPQVIETILPKAALAPRTAALRARELQRRFQCCGTHLAGLIADGELCCVGPPRPGATPSVLYQSAFEFLKRRSLTV
jgi:hypothetical protein